MNKTDITCLTPNFKVEDEDIIYEEIPIEVSLNGGVDFIEAGKITLKGKKAKTTSFMFSMLAILGVLFLAAIAALVAWYIIKGLGTPNISEDPHTINRKLKYIPSDDQEENPNNDTNQL